MNKKIKMIGIAAAFMGTALGIALFQPQMIKTNNAQEPPPEGVAGGEKIQPVSVTPARKMAFTDLLKTQGNLISSNYADVPAKIDGTLEAVFVEEGTRVQANETRLFKTESLKLEKNLEIRRYDHSVAHYGLLVKKAALEQVEADLDKAKTDYDRYKSLQANGTVSSDALEQQESRYRQLLASRKFTQAQIDLAAEQVSQAQTSLEIAQKDLRDAIALAPLSGVVSRRYQEPGEMGGPKSPVIRIEDASTIEVSALIPARYHAQVRPGQTRAVVTVYGRELVRLPVQYKSPTIDSKLRSFEIKCRLDNREGRLAPGAMADIQVIIESREGLGVPQTALVTRKGRQAVFTTDSGEARLVFVETGLETDGWVEVSGQGLGPETPVVTSGQASLDAGMKIRIIKEAD